MRFATTRTCLIWVLSAMDSHQSCHSRYLCKPSSPRKSSCFGSGTSAAVGKLSERAHARHTRHGCSPNDGGMALHRGWQLNRLGYWRPAARMIENRRSISIQASLSPLGDPSLLDPLLENADPHRDRRECYFAGHQQRQRSYPVFCDVCWRISAHEPVEAIGDSRSSRFATATSAKWRGACRNYASRGPRNCRPHNKGYIA
jgi:hypothetical protein